MNKSEWWIKPRNMKAIYKHYLCTGIFSVALLIQFQALTIFAYKGSDKTDDSAGAYLNRAHQLSQLFINLNGTEIKA